MKPLKLDHATHVALVAYTKASIKLDKAAGEYKPNANGCVLIDLINFDGLKKYSAVLAKPAGPGFIFYLPKREDIQHLYDRDTEAYLAELEETKNNRRYPHLTKILYALFSDNGMHPLPEKDWVWPKNVAVLEQQAAKLDEGEKEILACGEHTEMRQLVKAKKVQALDKFLERVFDGDLGANFVKD